MGCLSSYCKGLILNYQIVEEMLDAKLIKCYYCIDQGRRFNEYRL